jgi:hypothetical protein
MAAAFLDARAHAGQDVYPSALPRVAAQKAGIVVRLERRIAT